MSKKKKFDVDFDFEGIKFKATATLESVYTVSADPDRAKETRRIDEHNATIHKKHIQKYFDRANGKPLVRKMSFNGACSYKGILLRETSKFYVYAEEAHWSDNPIEDFPQKRILKSNVHLEPCKSCSDHPQTYYPRGSEN